MPYTNQNEKLYHDKYNKEKKRELRAGMATSPHLMVAKSYPKLAVDFFCQPKFSVSSISVFGSMLDHRFAEAGVLISFHCNDKTCACLNRSAHCESKKSRLSGVVFSSLFHSSSDLPNVLERVVG